jgi:hypothetical protein
MRIEVPDDIWLAYVASCDAVSATDATSGDGFPYRKITSERAQALLEKQRAMVRLTAAMEVTRG